MTSATMGLSPDGRTPSEQLALIRARVVDLMAEHSALFAGLREELAEAGVRIVDYADLPQSSRRSARAISRGDLPGPDAAGGGSGPSVPVHQHAQPVARGRRARPRNRRARVRAHQGAADPAALRRGRSRRVYVPIEQVIAANLDTLFAGMEILEAHFFRVTRNADLAHRRGRGRRPAARDRGGAASPAIRGGGPPRGRSGDARRHAPAAPAGHRRRPRRLSTRSTACST